MGNGKLSGGGGGMGKRVFYTLTSFFRGIKGIKGIKVLVWYQTYLSDVIISAALI